MKLFASCDSKYLHAHAPALVASAASVDNAIHLHVIDPREGDMEFLDHLSSRYHSIAGWPQSDFTYSTAPAFVDAANHPTFKNWPDAQRTVYACDRFLSVMTQMIARPDQYLIVDTDCLIMKHISESDLTGDVGLFPREPLPQTQGWENQGTRVAAGVVYYSSRSIDFAQAVANRIRQGPLAWFLDQVALSETYTNMKDRYSYHYFDEKFMDWEFIEGTTIWTGKGPRKYDNPTYLTKKNHFDRMIR
jgi:hypothetical protein